jgi:hypothetical protein
MCFCKLSTWYSLRRGYAQRLNYPVSLALCHFDRHDRLCDVSVDKQNLVGPHSNVQMTLTGYDDPLAQLKLRPLNLFLMCVILKMVQVRIATGVTRVIWTAVVLRCGKQMEKLPRYHFSWMISFQKQRFDFCGLFLREKRLPGVKLPPRWGGGGGCF